jgi:CMP-N-acetylneuraminic acid synthetase
MSDTLTIIPAKLGSTRLPQKNIKPLGGLPLLGWSVQAALDSEVCGDIVVSTESKRVKEVALKTGAQVPFFRPERLAKDPYGVVDVCLFMLEEFEKRSKTYGKLIILLPTAPFRSAEDIIAANKIFNANNGKYLMSVNESEHLPYSMLKIDKEKPETVIPCFPEYVGAKRHEVPKAYRPNGAIHILDVPAFMESRTYFGFPLLHYIMPPERCIDIDAIEDFEYAQYLTEKGKIDG